MRRVHFFLGLHNVWPLLASDYVLTLIFIQPHNFGINDPTPFNIYVGS